MLEYGYGLIFAKFQYDLYLFKLRDFEHYQWWSIDGKLILCKLNFIQMKILNEKFTYNFNSTNSYLIKLNSNFKI
jgi:hypothetical protein